MHTRKGREEFEEQLLTSEYEIHSGTYLVPGSAEVWANFDDYVTPSPKRPAIPGGWNPEDALLVQLRDSKGEPLGILSIDEPRSDRMPDLTELRLLRAICSHAEQSLENAHTSAQTEQHRSRMTQLLGTSTRLSECQTYSDVLEIACEALIPGLGFERVAIYFGEGNSSIPLAKATFDEVTIAKTIELPVFELFRDHTLAVGGCWMAPAQVIHGPAHGESHSRRNGAGKLGWCDDVLLAPVFDGDGVPRLVFAIEDPINHLRPTEIECELVRLLVEQTDAALERVTFRTRLEHLADHDAATGLLNRRALAHIPPEAPVAAALMICDIDYFKIVNDTYGHQIGDAVICRFADLLRSLSRKQDLAVRLGGDEFMVLLPGASLQQARAVADRLRVAISPLMSPLVSSEVTVSIGLTPIDAGEHLIDAMRRADSALYAAKKNGRNQIAFN